MKINYEGKELYTRFIQYADGNNCIQLVDEKGLPYCRATINVDAGLKDDEVAVKDYSESDGLMDALIKANVIHEPHRFYISGFVDVPICYLTDEAKGDM